MKTYRLILFTLLLAVGTVSCSRPWSPHTDEARQRAEQYAAKLIAVDRTDTLAMEHCIIEAKAAQGEYDLMGDSIAVRAFDEAFEDYLQKHDQKLAQLIFPPQKDKK